MEDTPEIKLCKDCKFCTGSDLDYARCTNFLAQTINNTILDRNMFITGIGTYAYNLRGDNKFCGMSAKYFEQKKPFLSRIFK